MRIEINEVSYRYDVPGDTWAVCDVALAIGQGEKIALVGPAGSGKTTLIQLIDALILPTKGDIVLDGQSVRALARARKLHLHRRRIGVLFQFPEHQFFQESAYDELVFALRNFLAPAEDEIERRAQALLEPLGMDGDRLKKTAPFNLSSGEKRKLALASALLMEPEVLILDEPTAAMDAAGRSEILRIITSLVGTTVILVTHNLEDFLPIIDRVIGMSRGKAVVDLQRDEVMDHLEDMQQAGIVPPLVMRVQGWLREAGCPLEDMYYTMDDLLAILQELV